MRGRRTLLALLAVSGSAVLELVAGPGHPLDPTPWRLEVAACLALLVAIVAGIAWLGASRRRTLALILCAWALVWGPQTQRALDLPPASAWAPAIVLGVVSWAHPPSAVFLGIVGPGMGVLGRRALHAQPTHPERPAASTMPDVLLITVDTVRADSTLTDPGVFPVDAGWIHHAEAIAPAPWTLPAMISVMQGRSVRDHGGGLPRDGAFSAPARAPALAQRFEEEGYLTHAFVSNPHLRAAHGFGAGFHVFWHSDDSREPLAVAHALTSRWSRLRGRPASVLESRDHRLVDQARSHIQGSATAPRFVWVHLLGPHEYARAPAVPPSGWAPGVEDLDVLREAYASNVAVAREQIRTLTEAAEGWVVAVTSDHGEAFGEGGHRGHGRALQDAELQVPLVLRGPGLSGGVVVEQVALAEVGPWLLEPREGGLPPRAAVPVGGVRRDATAFAVRESGGVYDAQEPPGEGGTLLEMDLETRAALEAMGYTDPE